MPKQYNADYHYICNNKFCDNPVIESDQYDLKRCPYCAEDDIQECCPMCGSRIDSDTKVCPECKETVK